MNKLELVRERRKVLEQGRAIVDRSERENRDMSPDEEAQFNKMMGDVDALGKRVAKLEAVETKEDENEESQGKQTADDGSDGVEGQEGDDGDDNDRSRSRRSSVWDRRGETRTNDPLSSKEYRAAFTQWFKGGHESVSPQYRDAILGTNSQGGYFALPTKLSKQFVIALDAKCFMRDLATVEELTEAKSLGVRQMTTQPSDASWSGEITQVVADTAMAVNQRALTPTILTKLVTESIQLLYAAPDAEGIILDRLAYKNAIASENAWLTGSGSSQPLGLFTASSNGIPTTQDVTASVALASNFTADDVITAHYNNPAQYRASAKYGSILHRSVTSYVRKLKDSYGQYLWQMGIAADRPDTLLGKPCYESEFAPSLNAGAPTASQYVLIFGDHSYYTWCEVVPPAVQRLVERYADLNEVGFLSRYFADGAPVLSSAFTRLKLASS
jgi:HK97 family phage major capsid protein